KRQHTQQRHLETATRVRCQWQVTATVQGQLIEQLYILGADLPGQLQNPRLVTQAVIRRLRQYLGDGHSLQGGYQLGQHARKISALLGQLGNSGEERARIPGGQCLQKAEYLTVIDGAEHAAHLGGLQLAITEDRKSVV